MNPELDDPDIPDPEHDAQIDHEERVERSGDAVDRELADLDAQILDLIAVRDTLEAENVILRRDIEAFKEWVNQLQDERGNLKMAVERLNRAFHDHTPSACEECTRFDPFSASHHLPSRPPMRPRRPGETVDERDLEWELKNP